MAIPPKAMDPPREAGSWPTDGPSRPGRSWGSSEGPGRLDPESHRAGGRQEGEEPDREEEPQLGREPQEHQDDRADP